MFESMRNQQAVADALKAEVQRRISIPQERRSAVKRINNFEGARWNPTAFETALQAVKGLTVEIGERGHVTFAWDRSGKIGPAVHCLFDTYYQVLGEAEVIID